MNRWKWTVAGVMLIYVMITIVTPQTVPITRVKRKFSQDFIQTHPLQSLELDDSPLLDPVPIPGPLPVPGPSPVLEELETNLPQTSPSRRCDRRTPYRTFDGTCNNFYFPTWGRAAGPFIRFLPPDYADGVGMPRAGRDGTPLITARRVSTGINLDQPIENPHFTNLFTIWGQFINHDVNNKLLSLAADGSILDLTACCFPDGSPNPDPGCLPIPIGPDDPFYSRFGVGCMSVIRAAAFPSNRIVYRENINNNTAFIDASMIYGSDAETASSLRLFRNGLIQHTPLPQGKPLLPLTGTDVNACPSVTGVCFRSGDFRVNMLPPLTVLHTMLMREHNRIALELSHINPHWGDERTYQETRRILGAIVQHITYNEYLPLVLSPGHMKAFELYLYTDGYYDGYDPLVNPSISNAFAAAAYRFGHSLIQGRYQRYHGSHQKLSGLAPPLSLELREPMALFNGELEMIAVGLVNQRARDVDQHFTEQVTNHLFENVTIGPGSGLDLLSINIHRGRENGIPSYNEWREFCGLRRAVSFADLHDSMPIEVIDAFARLYKQVDDIDLFPAGIAEFKVPGGVVGPTFACIIAQQFRNLRRGDRFWYENGEHQGSFNPVQLTEIRKTSLARLFCNNFETVHTIQLRPMEVPKGSRVHCSDPYLKSLNLLAWKEVVPPVHQPTIQGLHQPTIQSMHPRGLTLSVDGPAFVRVYQEMTIPKPAASSRKLRRFIPPPRSYPITPEQIFRFGK